MIVKTDFLISPAYCVPPISTSLFGKLTMMKASEWVPSSSGTAWNRGVPMTVNSGLWVRSLSGSSSRMNIFLENKLCHAISVITRIGTRYRGSAPA